MRLGNYICAYFLFEVSMYEDVSLHQMLLLISNYHALLSIVGNDTRQVRLNVRVSATVSTDTCSKMINALAGLALLYAKALV